MSVLYLDMRGNIIFNWMQKQDLELDWTVIALQMAEYCYCSTMILNFLPVICSSLRLNGILSNSLIEELKLLQSKYINHIHKHTEFFHKRYGHRICDRILRRCFRRQSCLCQ